MGRRGTDWLDEKGQVWRCWPPSEALAQAAPDIYDVAIVGAGVVGCALAYRLSQHRVRVLVVDKNYDVGEGTSKGNSAIIHTGFDATPGTLESQLVTRASHEWPQLVEKLKVPFDPVSAILLAADEEQARQLPKLHDKALANGVDDVEMWSAKRVREVEPQVSKEVQGGLYVPRESIVDPFAVSIAYAEVALANGTDFLLGAEVVGIEDCGGPTKTLVAGGGHRVRCRIVVNVAGLGSREVADLYGGRPFDINPRRGQFLLFDRNLRHLVNHILLPVPTEKTKGKLVSPTIFGNILAGPTAEDLPLGEAEATCTTVGGLSEVSEAATRFCPFLAMHRPIATYAGLRCNCQQGSYQVFLNDTHPGIVTVTGVRSTGLTSSPAFADYLIEQMAEQCDLRPSDDPDAIDERPADCWPGWWRRPYDSEGLVAQQPDCGRMVCYCEQISRQEIIDALNSPLCPPTLDAVKRRTRSMTGRCQAFNCGIPIAEVIAEHCDLPIESITKRGPGTSLCCDATSPHVVQSSP